MHRSALFLEKSNITNRSVKDQKSGETLVYPDQLLFSVLDENPSADRQTIITMTVSFRADLSQFQGVQNLRQIALLNTFMSLSAPKNDPQIHSFKFTKTRDLQGVVVVAVDSAQIDSFFSKLKADSGLFSPEYQGDTEEYFTEVVTAKWFIRAGELAEFNKRTPIVDMLLQLEAKVDQSITSDSKHQLIQQLLDRVGRFNRRADDQSWELIFDSNTDQVFTLSKVMEKTDRIYGTHNEISVEVNR